jgi:hypothetical protein
MSEDLTEGMDTSIPGDNSTEETTEDTISIPEGFDDTLYDVDTKSLRIDEVKKRFDADKKEIENYKKQALDMRRKLSKGADIPDSVDKYEYTPDAKYDKYLLDEESIEGKHIKEVMDSLSQFSHDNGLTLEASKNLKEFALKYMENVQILDTRDEEQIKQAQKQNIERQREILGANAGDIIKDNVEFFKDRGFFNNEERKWIMAQLSNSGHANNIFRKVREYMNTGVSYDIPQTNNEISNIEDLRNEYINPNTSDARREQIISKSMREGWKLF